MLYIDLETRSATDLKMFGVYKYVEDPFFKIQLMSYAYDDGEVQILDFETNALLVIPEQVKKDILDPHYIKVIHNSQFERVCFSHEFGMPSGTYIDPEGWICTSTLGLYRGFPAALGPLGKALHLPEDAQKMKEGKRLIAKFAVPHYTKTGEMYFEVPQFDLFGVEPDWETYKEYNKQDVETERIIFKTLKGLGGAYGETEGELWSSTLWKEFWVSERINDSGVRLDKRFIDGALKILDVFYQRQEVEFQRTCDEYADLKGVPHIENPGSVDQLKKLTGKSEFRKADLVDYLNAHKDATSKEEQLMCKICEFRLSNGKTSVKKFIKMQGCLCADGRAHGLFVFGGAGQTLRYAGKLVQLQNLSKNHFGATEVEGVLVSPEIQIYKQKIGDVDMSVLDEDGDFLDLLSQLVRPSLIPAKGHIFAVADFSAIEARVLSWLAGEQWRIDAFRNGADIYCETASRMFGVPVVKHGENGELRAKGKVAELACGYGGGASALAAFGADKMLSKEINRDEIIKTLDYDVSKLTPDALDFAVNEAISAKVNEQLQEIVTNWRNSSPKVTELWWELERAFKECLLTGRAQSLFDFHDIKLYTLTNDTGGNDVVIELPNGRSLFYNEAKVKDKNTGEILNLKGQHADKYNLNVLRKNAGEITFMRPDKKGILETTTYSGKLTENVIQAMARDVLQQALATLAERGYKVVAHIHDEVIVDMPKYKLAEDGVTRIPKTREEITSGLKEVSDIMAIGCPWCTDLPLRADGYLCNYYMKDSDSEAGAELLAMSSLEDEEEYLDEL